MAEATDVYRLGRRDVHHAFRSGGVVFEHDSCRLDGKGNAWLPVPPPGPRCGVCFVGSAGPKRRGPGVSKAAFAGSAAALALAAAVFASSLGEPVNLLVLPTASGPAFPSPVVTPGPSLVPPASEAPALTYPPVGPTTPPLVSPTAGPIPTFPPLPTYPPVPTWPPLPTFGPLPVPPLPTIAPFRPCVHPGTHLGVDPCRWPHN